ncbi:MAG TPA: DUF1415 domain-containing protein [Polyangiaceae bacterium]|nr:DUF1415 domain-containing protein [Polyangiaceae bacterium]
MAERADWPSEETVIARTRAWLTQIVIGLELCPFAKPVYVKDQIRYVVSSAETPEALLEDLLRELQLLSQADPALLDTTLLIHPRALPDFLDYNDFLGVTELALEDLGLAGHLQIASFHPDYRYADNAADDLANYVTRSPYPMLHLLREASVDRAVAVFPDASVIVDKNIETLRALGLEGWRRLMAEVLSR